MRTLRRKKPDKARQTAFFRYMLIVAVLIIWIGGIGARLVYLQVDQHGWLKARAVGQRVDVKQTKMLRGTIFDRNNRALAVSVMSKTLFADPTEIDNIEEAAADLAKVLKTNEAGLSNLLREAKDLQKRFVPLVKGLDDEAVQAINAALETDGIRKSDHPKYPGLHWRDEQKRTYPNQSLAAHVVGFSNNEGIGQAGVEQSQNDVLYGAVIKKIQERDRLGRIYDEKISEKEPPNDIVLTISSSMQFKVESALEKGVKASASTAGMAIVLDHRTGEIIALANFPTFDPNRLESINSENLKNRSVQGMYAPGSVFKLITYSSAFERNLISLDSSIDAGNGVIDVAGHIFRDPHASGSVNVMKAFASSSNICAIKTGMRVGRDGFYSAMKKYGFGRSTGVELPAETPGVVRDPAKWYGDSLASMSIGYEIGVTALQMATAFATIANDGVRIQPHIIKEIRQSDQTKVFESQPKAERAVSHETANSMKALMRAVVTSGTGKAAQLNGYTSAGKTGTAWKFDEKLKRVSSAKYVSSFIGFAPLDDPKFTIAVVMDEPKVGSRNGGQVAAPVFREIAESVLAEMQVPFDLAEGAQTGLGDENDLVEPVGNGDEIVEPETDPDSVDKRSDKAGRRPVSDDPKTPQNSNRGIKTERKSTVPPRKRELETPIADRGDKFKT